MGFQKTIVFPEVFSRTELCMGIMVVSGIIWGIFTAYILIYLW